MSVDVRSLRFPLIAGSWLSIEITKRGAPPITMCYKETHISQRIVAINFDNWENKVFANRTRQRVMDPDTVSMHDIIHTENVLTSYHTSL